MNSGRLAAVALWLAAAFFCLCFAGCTQLERDGISPIPQNSPGSWEINPYNIRS